MTRRAPFQEMFDLPIGAEMTVAPDRGEPIEAALKRLKQRVSKYLREDRSFRLKIDGEAIRVQRMPLGANKKLADWEAMKAGDRLLLKTNPTEADIKSAKATANYLTALKRPHDRTCFGGWDVVIDEEGRLVAQCHIDRERNTAFKQVWRNAPVKYLWSGEWA